MKNHNISFNTEQWNLFQTAVSCAPGVCIVFTLLSLHSEWSQGFHIHVSYEVRPSPDVAVLLKHWLCYLWDCSVSSAQTAQDMEGWTKQEDGGCLFFF